MAILQVRDIDDELYNTIKKMAEKERRSISQEVISILQEYIQKSGHSALDATEDFLNLCGSWDDAKTAKKIISDIKKSRRNSARFREKHALFD